MGNSNSSAYKHFANSSEDSENCEVTSEKIATAEINWIIENFGFKSATSKVGSMKNSANFCASQDKKVKWYLCIYPNGKTEADKGYVSLFLHINSQKFPKAPVNVSFRLWDNSNLTMKELLVKNFNYVLNYRSCSMGFYKIIEHSKVSGIKSLLISCKMKYNLYGQQPIESIITNLSSPAGSSLSEHNAKLFKTMHNSDVCFRVEDQEIRAHKFILISRSPVFTAMFDQQMTESQTEIVDIADISPHTFRSVLYFMYTDKVKLETVEEAKNLLFAAEKYKLDLLKFKCEKILILCLDSNNCLDVKKAIK